MSFARVNFTSTVTPETGGGGAVGGWKTLQFGDVTKENGSYTMTHEAGQNGFAHRITIDPGANSQYLDITKCAWLYYDTGISMATLSTKKAVTVSVLAEFSIAPDSPLGADATNRFQFAVYFNNNANINSGATGWYGGLIANANAQGTNFFYMSDQVARMGQVTSVSLGTLKNGTGDNEYSHAGGDILQTVQVSGTGYNGAEGGNKYGFTGGDLVVGHTKGASGPYVTNETEKQNHDGRIAGVGNLHVGIFFGQKVGTVGAGNSKTFDFDLKYLVESVDA